MKKGVFLGLWMMLAPLIGVCQAVVAETFVNLSSRESYSMVLADKDTSDYYFASGYTNKDGHVDPVSQSYYQSGYVAKLNGLGDTAKTRLFSSYLFGYCKILCQTKGGDILLESSGPFVGSTHPFLKLYKLSRELDTLWSRTYNQRVFNWLFTHSSLPMPDGGWIIAGTRGSQSAEDCYAIRFDSLGNVLYDQTFSTPSSEEFHHLSIADDGNYLISGIMRGGGQGFLCKFNPLTGQKIWQKQFAVQTSQVFSQVKVQQTTYNDYTVVALNDNNLNTIVARFDSSFSYPPRWSVTASVRGGGIGSPLDDGGAFFMLYEVTGAGNNPDCRYKRYNSSGGLVWNTLVLRGSYQQKGPSDFAFTLRNSAVGVGLSRMSGGAEDFYFIRLEGTGNPYVPGTITPVGLPARHSVVSAQLAPNPAQGHTRLLLPEARPSDINQVEFIDASRRVAGTFSFTGTESTLDLSGLAQGIYSLQVRGVRTVWRSRLVKE